MSYLSITHPLNGLLCVGLGVGLGIYLTRHFKLSWRLWWIGAFTFFLSQVGHIPFNYLVLDPLVKRHLDTLPEPWQILLVALFLGLSAGVFEEFTRYAVYRWWIKDARTFYQGLLFGAGHGGLEAISIGVLSLYAYLQMVALQDIDLSTIVPAKYLTLAQEQISWYWSMPWYDSILGSVERFFALPVHLCAALLVLLAFTRRQVCWVWVAVGLHALVDALALYLSQMISVYAAELSLGILAILLIGIILLLRKSMLTAPPNLTITPAQVWDPIAIQGVSETPDALEETRYQKV